MTPEEYLDHPGLSFPRFIIYEATTGRYIDDARSIRERNEKIRGLRKWRGFDIRWDFYRAALIKANPPGILIFRGFHYSLETAIARELERLPAPGAQV